MCTLIRLIEDLTYEVGVCYKTTNVQERQITEYRSLKSVYVHVYYMFLFVGASIMFPKKSYVTVIQINVSKTKVC